MCRNWSFECSLETWAANLCCIVFYSFVQKSCWAVSQLLVHQLPSSFPLFTHCLGPGESQSMILSIMFYKQPSWTPLCRFPDNLYFVLTLLIQKSMAVWFPTRLYTPGGQGSCMSCSPLGPEFLVLCLVLSNILKWTSYCADNNFPHFVCHLIHVFLSLFVTTCLL